MPIIKNVAIPIKIPFRLYVVKNSIMCLKLLLIDFNKKTDSKAGFLLLCNFVMLILLCDVQVLTLS
jgi:hypothetical protein